MDKEEKRLREMLSAMRSMGNDNNKSRRKTGVRNSKIECISTER